MDIFSILGIAYLATLWLFSLTAAIFSALMYFRSKDVLNLVFKQFMCDLVNFLATQSPSDAHDTQNDETNPSSNIS